MPEAVASAEASSVILTCFEVQGQLHAIEVEHVREIARIVEITPLPNAPALIEGVIDLRGTVIPVVDLARVLNRGRGSTDADARIIVIEVEGLVFGVWVDAATDVLTLDTHHMEDVPDLATHAGYDVVRHVVRREGAAPIMVLAVDRLVETIFRSALADAAVGGRGAMSSDAAVGGEA
jgi:purine-binding chemotaxis protein CheW